MRWIMVALLAVSLTAGFGIVEGFTQEKRPTKEKTPKPDPKKVKELMTMKLEHSQKLLGALVVNDLDKAAKHAEELMRIRKEASFIIVKTKLYEMWSDEFARSAEKIVKGAKDKNSDTARLAYLEMTMTCFNCHTYVRDLGDIRFEGISH
jgi:hypothetical protein